MAYDDYSFDELRQSFWISELLDTLGKVIVLAEVYYTKKSKKVEFERNNFRILAMEMETPDSTEKDQTEPPTLKELIKIEWEIVNELKKMLKDPELTVAERTRAATVFAYHTNTLNKFLAQSGEKDQFEEQNLGDYVRGVEPRIARRVRRDFRLWKRVLTSRRYWAI